MSETKIFTRYGVLKKSQATAQSEAVSWEQETEFAKVINLLLTSITPSADAGGMFCSLCITLLTFSIQKTIWKSDKPLRSVNAEYLVGGLYLTNKCYWLEARFSNS